MGDLWRFLIDNPIILLLLVTWLFGLLGKVLQGAGQRARKAAQDAAREQQQQRPQRPAARGAPASPARPAPQPPRPVSADEAIAEMRRILAGEMPEPRPPELPRKPPKPPPKPPPVRAQPARKPLSAPLSQPARPRELGRMEVQVDPQVGEGMARRAAPSSGLVGAGELGDLGGRVGLPRRALRADRGLLVDLSDLKRAIVLREVLGPPVALREGWGEPGGAGKVT